MVHRILVLALLTTLPTTTVAANGITVAKHANPAPDDIAAPVKAALASGGATATAGDTVVFEVPTTAGALRFGLILSGHIEA